MQNIKQTRSAEENGLIVGSFHNPVGVEEQAVAMAKRHLLLCVCGVGINAER